MVFVNPQERYDNLKTKFERIRILLISKGYNGLCEYKPTDDGGLISSIKIPTHK